MLSIRGCGSKLCDGLTRREMMRVGGLSLFAGLTLPRLLRAETSRAKARSVILFNLLGGPSHQDMVDLKPNAPLEIRGPFKPISTSVPGIQICEHLPNLALWMHRACLIRTFSHSFNSHDPFPFLTGYTDQGFTTQAQPSDPPDIGAICQYLGMGPRDMPGAVCMPCYPGWGEAWKRRGPYGGFLGSQYDPLFTRCQPTFEREPKVQYYDPVLPIGEPLLPSFDMLPEITVDRFQARRSLFEQLDGEFTRARQSPALARLDKVQQRAFAMLTSSKTRTAFDLAREPVKLRQRYGKSLTGNCLLMARRLVEAGVPFVSVHQEIFGKYGHSYDMHENNFGMLKDFNLPLLDRVVPALLEDLNVRGLLDSTLVVVMGEMGRSPRVNAKAGRDHWPQCGFSLLFGAGVKQGHVHGATDKSAGFPIDHPVSPGDFVATIYALLGIDPEMTVPDRDGRPIPIAHGGRPIRGVLA
jgi:Protein of unknown function (DUF1501)